MWLFVFIHRMVFPPLCHFTGPLLNSRRQTRIHRVLVSDLKDYSFLLSHSNVLKLPENCLIYNPSPHALASLIPSISGKQREHFRPRLKGFVATYLFLWGQLHKCFSGNSVGVVYSELNCRLFRPGEDLKKKINKKQKAWHPTHSFNRWEN